MRSVLLGTGSPAPLDRVTLSLPLMCSSLPWLTGTQDLLTGSLSVFALKKKPGREAPGASGKRKQSC